MLAKLWDATIGQLSLDRRVLLWRLVVSVHILWACNLLSDYGLSGFARADEADTAHAELRREFDGKLNEIRADLDEIKQQQVTGLQILMAQEICRLYRLREQASGQLARTLSDSFEEKQQAFSRLTGSRYPVMECAP